MAYHAINKGGLRTVYSNNYLSETIEFPLSPGKLYSGECFIVLGPVSSVNSTLQIYFRNSSGELVLGFIEPSNVENMIYSGVKVNSSVVGTNYRFKLRRDLSIVDKNNYVQFVLKAGNYIYTNTGTAGSTQNENLAINAYKKDGKITYYNGFVRLHYSAGSMLSSNFDLIAE